MNEKPKIGVFLCECGEKIASLVNLPGLCRMLSGQPDIAHCEVMPYGCLKPGLERMMTLVADKGLNRLVVAGCEGRLMLKKLEKQMEPLGILKGQIDMVNLRGHVASVSDLLPEQKAEKGARLVAAAVAEMAALAPTIQTLARISGPVAIVGGGAASYAAAQELAQAGIDFLLQTQSRDPDAVLRRLHESYTGERTYYGRLKAIIQEAFSSPHATLLPSVELTGLSGVTGQYSLTFSDPEGNGSTTFKAGAIIACIDAELQPSKLGFGYDGRAVLTQADMEELIWREGTPKGRTVFWVSDHETGHPEFARLSAKCAWSMARHIRESSKKSEAYILYNEKMEIPLSAAERALNRKLDILWIPYAASVRPVLQDRYVTFCGVTDHIEQEIGWDHLVLSPERVVNGEGLRTARVLGLVHKEGRFLTGHHARVRPEMVGREETYLAGSGRYPCDLHEALTQGRRAGIKTVEMLRKSEAAELYVPRIVCVVDPAKCIGCGQCQELCDCGGIGIEEGPAGGLPRVVDPMVCTGGGTCAAACPYHALVLQNNSNDQREARVAALARSLPADGIIAIGCAWAGLPAADIAGKAGLKYDPRVHILGVPCIGQIDPSIMARAFVEGAPGLLLIGCPPEECHHSHGVDHAWSRVALIKKLLTLSGFDRRRIALSHADLNKPEEFVRTVESFTAAIQVLGPIERTRENISRLQSIYDMVNTNTRIRHLLSASLRRPGEDTYRGEQRHALDYDRDFSAAIKEEFLQHRLMEVLRGAHRPFKLHELAVELGEAQSQVAQCLWGMIGTGSVNFAHKDHEALYEANG